ncbi:MAG: hypothetical protein IPO98_19035 [Saprospiraceae bacterium]|nr:hypothetical protein [Saprospiraceae bacterium]
MRIVKDYKNGVLSDDNYYFRIDLIKWGLIDDIEGDPNVSTDENDRFDQENIDTNGNDYENENHNITQNHF